MSAPRYRPKRRLRSEIFPLAAIVSLPLALYLAFPRGAIGFMPNGQSARTATTRAFISLDGERQLKLLASARASWQTDSASRRGVRANLLKCDFRSSGTRLTSGISPSFSERMDASVEYEIKAVPHGVAADAPVSLPADIVEVAQPAFSKSDLLKIK